MARQINGVPFPGAGKVSGSWVPGGRARVNPPNPPEQPLKGCGRSLGWFLFGVMVVVIVTLAVMRGR